VAAIVIVTGDGPHENVMMPPAATAATTAAEVQLAGVPRPTTRVGCEVSTAAASAGIAAAPFRLPYLGSAGGCGVAVAPGPGVAEWADAGGGDVGADAGVAGEWPQAPAARTVKATTTPANVRMAGRIARC
jgi:hypothetical protein